MGCIYTLAVKGALLGKWFVKAISHWPKEHKKWGFCQLGKSQHPSMPRATLLAYEGQVKQRLSSQSKQ